MGGEVVVEVGGWKASDIVGYKVAGGVGGVAGGCIVG